MDTRQRSNLRKWIGENGSEENDSVTSFCSFSDSVSLLHHAPKIPSLPPTAVRADMTASIHVIDNSRLFSHLDKGIKNAADAYV